MKKFVLQTAKRPTTARPRYVFCLLMISLISGCISHSHAERDPIDCSLPHVDQRLSQCKMVRRASEFSGCLSTADISEHSCLLMDADVSFCSANDSLPITAFFDQNQRTLDCAGGAIDHGWGRVSLPQGIATTQRTRMPAVRLINDQSLSDITVRNCTLRGTNHMGIEATRFFGGELGPDGKVGAGEALPVGHQKLRFENLVIEDTITGIYLGNYSHDVDIHQVSIDNTQRIAIYSEAGSHDVRIRQSLISNNQSREAIAIDSTYDSEVSDTLFVNNREGGINVYQNCGELKGIVCPVIRSTPPNNNRIIGNRFVNTGVSGVQIASRQGRRHRSGWCATLDGRSGKFTDTAEGNLVADNTFVCHEGTSLVIQDGPNTIRDNTVVARQRCVPYEVSTGGHGRSKRHLLDGLQLLNNRIDTARPPRLRNLSDEVTIRQ
ncbi:right-handed parallel beta-helix repeat-containing protein [Granulosicoccus sp. 3-233]|uniref:right-handed parallel beta-helix repeat-containing protein n=1 Tax=Granulosicoccus sp. 3-233 TaxID=3417969 RepID=UPI003D3572EE